MDQIAQQRLVFNDLDIVLDVVAARQTFRESREIVTPPTDSSFFFLLASSSESVTRSIGNARRVVQLHHARVDAAMRVEREIVCLDGFGGLRENVVIEKDGAQARALGIERCRHAAFEMMSALAIYVSAENKGQSVRYYKKMNANQEKLLKTGAETLRSVGMCCGNTAAETPHRFRKKIRPLGRI